MSRTDSYRFGTYRYLTSLKAHISISGSEGDVYVITSLL
jgi:hypothetical protein